jgi:hypothetical protein
MDDGEKLASMWETRPTGHNSMNRKHREREDGLVILPRPLERLEGTASTVVAMVGDEKPADVHG